MMPDVARSLIFLNRNFLDIFFSFYVIRENIADLIILEQIPSYIWQHFYNYKCRENFLLCVCWQYNPS